MPLFARILTAVTLPFLLVVAFFKRARPFRGSFPRARRLYRKRLPGAVASDGSAYSVYFKKGTIDKTVVYFSGGGACWDEYTAARPTTVGRLLGGKEAYYYPFVRFYLENWMNGLVAADDARNLFNDWNYIYLPYATGDFHIGGGDFAYRAGSREKTLRHHGGGNVRATLEAVPKDFLEAENVLVAGESAGAFAALAWMPELASYFPACKHFTLFADGAQLCGPTWPGVLRDVWKTDAHFYECLRGDGQLVRDWFRYLHESLGGRVTALHAVSPYDEVLAQYESRFNGGPYAPCKAALGTFHTRLSQAVRSLTAEVPEYRAYIYNHGKNETTGATAHTIARTPANLYADQTEGLTVAEWVRRAADGDNVPNIGLEWLEEMTGRE